MSKPPGHPSLTFPPGMQDGDLVSIVSEEGVTVIRDGESVFLERLVYGGDAPPVEDVEAYLEAKWGGE